MADESTTTPATEDTTQTQPADGSGGGEPRTFTQEQVDKMIQARVARVKSTPPADYEELKAKAAKLDELEEANKTELEKAQGSADKWRSKADEWKAKYEALEAEQQRAREIAQMAAQYDVDADMLSRMAGDVEDNAKYLASVEAARPKFGAVHDDGEQGSTGRTLEEIRAIRNPTERIRARAEYIASHGQ